jgi:hypothetical protein
METLLEIGGYILKVIGAIAVVVCLFAFMVYRFQPTIKKDNHLKGLTYKGKK